MKYAILLLMIGIASAMPIDVQGSILRAARSADIAAYYSFSGVVLEDLPTISPFFACQRAYIYQNYSVNGTLMVDRIACLPNSFYKQAWYGIQMCGKGDSLGKKYIDWSIAYNVNYVCA